MSATAIELEKQGNFEGAKSLWKNAIENHNSTTARINLAKHLITYNEASSEIENLLLAASRGCTEDEIDEIGFVAIHAGKPDLANRLFSSYPNQECGAVLNGLGAVHFELNNFQDAQAYFRRAVLAGYSFHAIANLGQVSAVLGNLKEAAECFAKASEIKTNFGGEFELWVAKVYQSQNCPSEANDWYATAADLGNPEAMYQIAHANWVDGETKSAQKWAQLGAKLGHSGSLALLGHLSMDSGSNQLAEKYLRKAAEAGDPWGMNMLGLLLDERMGKPDEGMGWLLRSANLGFSPAHFNIGRIHFMRGEFDEAQNWLNTASESNHSGAFQLLGEISFDKGDLASAEFSFRKAIQLGNSSVISKLCELFEKQERFSELEELLKR
jgi:tetratricopeptide (TPR) repeat protein